MSGQAEILHHHGRFSIPNGPPHIGHAYDGARHRRHCALRAARRQGRVLPDRHRRARPQDEADGGRGRHHAARAGRPQLGALPRHGAALNVSNDDFIRTTEPRHYRSSEEIWRRMENAKRRHLSRSKYAGWYSVREEAFFDEKETTVGAGRRAPRAAGLAGRVDGGGDLFLPPLGLPGPAARALREAPRLHPAARAAQRGGELRQGRAWRTSRSRARRSTGASRCRAATRRNGPSTSCTCGSTR